MPSKRVAPKTSLEAALRERDAALQELAELKAQLSAHQLECPFPFAAPQRAAVHYLEHGEEPPLRHQLVDAVNDRLKQSGLLGAGNLLHKGVREVLGKLPRRGK